MRRSALALCLLIPFAVPAAPEPTYRRIEVLSREASLQIGYAERALGMNDLDAALLHARSALRMEPKAVEPHVMMGIVTGRRGDHPAAQRSFDKAIDLDPDFFPAWYYRAQWRCERSHWSEAFEDFERSFQARRQSDPLLARREAIRCALTNGQREAAKNFLDDALQVFPESPDLLLLGARLALNDGEILRARAFLQRSEALRNLDEPALQLAIDIERAAGDDRTRKRYEARLQELRDTPRP